MSNRDSSNKPPFLASIGLTLPTIIQIVSLGAVVVAQWTVLNREVGEFKSNLAAVIMDLRAVERRMYALEQSDALTAADLVNRKARADELRARVGELERDVREIERRRASRDGGPPNNYYVDRPADEQQ